MPKNEKAKSIKTAKKIRLGSQWVLNQLAAPGPKTTATTEDEVPKQTSLRCREKILVSLVNRIQVK